MQKEINELSIKLSDKLTTKNENFETGVSKTEGKLKQAEEELENLKSTQIQLEDTKNKLEIENQRLQNETKEHQEQLTKLKEHTEQQEKMQKEIKELNIKLSDTVKRVSDKENEIRTLSQQLIDTQNENDKLRIEGYNISQAGKDPIKAMVVLAGPGEDKSGLCDLFSGTENNFDANQEKTIGKLVKWRGDGDPFLLIDTPVFEPEEDVAETTKIMMNELKKYKNMYVFVIALNGTNPRIDQNRKKMIRELKKMFGHTFIDKNTVFAITNWHYDQGSIEKRGKNGQKEAKVNENLKKELNLSNVNIAFLDASCGEERIEKDKIEEQLHKMKHWLFTIPAYPCTHLN